MKWFLGALIPFVVLASVVWLLPAASKTTMPSAPYFENRSASAIG